MSHDPAYYVMRATEEHRLAMASADPRVKRVHLELAAEYAILAGSGASAKHQASQGEKRRAG